MSRSRDVPEGEVHSLDARGLLCPLPVRLAARRAAELPGGALLEVVGTDPALPLDFAAWCHDEGHELVERTKDGAELRVLVRLGVGKVGGEGR